MHQPGQKNFSRPCSAYHNTARSPVFNKTEKTAVKPENAAGRREKTAVCFYRSLQGKPFDKNKICFTKHFLILR
jgi:hypothetical protein